MVVPEDRIEYFHFAPRQLGTWDPLRNAITATVAAARIRPAGDERTLLILVIAQGAKLAYSSTADEFAAHIRLIEIGTRTLMRELLRWRELDDEPGDTHVFGIYGEYLSDLIPANGWGEHKAMRCLQPPPIDLSDDT